MGRKDDFPGWEHHRIFFRAWRQRADLTQREVAMALRIGINTVSYWDGGRAPHLRYLPDIAQLFGCTIDDLYTEPRKG